MTPYFTPRSSVSIVNFHHVIAGWEWKDKFLRFKIFDDRIDSFFAEFMRGNSKFKCCWEVFKLTFILSHGQASVARGFSINKELLTENLEEVSIVSQRIVYDHIYDLSVTYVPFSNDLLKSYKPSPLIENEKSRKRKRAK